MDIFRIMAAILKLGNVNFIPTTNMDGTEGCAISNDYGELFSWKHARCLTYVLYSKFKIKYVVAI